jgi:hypothetical protein
VTLLPIFLYIILYSFKYFFLSFYTLDYIAVLCCEGGMPKSATAPQRKEVMPGMRKMVVEVPEDVFKALKFRAVEQDATLKELVTDALRRYLGIKEGGETGKKA